MKTKRLPLYLDLSTTRSHAVKNRRHFLLSVVMLPGSANYVSTLIVFTPIHSPADARPIK